MYPKDILSGIDTGKVFGRNIHDPPYLPWPPWVTQRYQMGENRN